MSSPCVSLGIHRMIARFQEQAFQENQVKAVIAFYEVDLFLTSMEFVRHNVTAKIIGPPGFKGREYRSYLPTGGVSKTHFKKS